MTDLKRRVLLYLAIAVAVAGAAYGAASLLAEEERGPDGGRPAVAAPVVPAPGGGGGAQPRAAAPGVRVLEVVGTVDRVGAGGSRRAVAEGSELAVDDTLVTGAASRVRLEVGARSTVDLAQDAEVKVRELSESVQRLGLVYGRAAVDYREDGGRVLRIENEDGSAVAQVTAGKFSILSTGTTVAVATETGQVDLSAAGKTVTVGASQQSIVAGGAPLDPLAIPKELVLRVVDPGCRVQREAFYTVSGRTAPGSRVSVNGKAARVKGSGEFSLRVPLKAGRNQIAVVTEDAAGRSERRTISCITVDPGAPISGVDIEWGGGGG
jgi:hypothetical protein